MKIDMLVQLFFRPYGPLQEHIQAQDQCADDHSLQSAPLIGTPDHDLPLGVRRDSRLIQDLQIRLSKYVFRYFRIVLDHRLQYVISHLRVIGRYGYGQHIHALFRFHLNLSRKRL